MRQPSSFQEVRQHELKTAVPIRIGINALLLWGKFSGVERAIHSLIQALINYDGFNQYAIYVPIEFQGFDGCGMNFGIIKTRVPARFRLLRIFVEQCAFPRILVRDDIDVLHCPAYVMPINSPSPTVVTMYDVLALSHPHLCRRANRWHYQKMLPLSAHKAARIIVPSNRVKQDLLSFVDVPPDKVRVIPLGVDSHFRPVTAQTKRNEVRAKHRLPEKFILFVGNFEPRKNLPTLLAAYGKLKRSTNPSTSLRASIGLVLVGAKAWGTKDALAKASELGATILHGVSDEDLPAIYSAAQVFAFPSLYEGFGLPPLEAMACGTPVVASTGGALPEVLGDAALLVEPTDPNALAEAIELVIEDEKMREQLKAKGLQRAKRFDWEQTAKATVALYRRVFEESL